MTDAFEWQGRVGETWAAEWRRTDRSFSGLTRELLDRIARKSFSTMLDIGCGAGELSLAVGRARRDATVTGIDISGPLIAAARERGHGLANVTFLQADASDWRPDAHARPDLLVSRHGVMFFPDPPAAFANLAAGAQPHASLLFSCFRDRTENPFFTEVVSFLPPPEEAVDPKAPGPFAFADKNHVRSILEAGGWTDIVFDRFDFAMIAGAGEDPVEEALQYFSRIGPAANALRDMDDSAHEEFSGKVRELAEAHCQDGIVSLRAAAWFVSARKA